MKSFNSFMGMASQLSLLAAGQDAVTLHLLERAGVIVEKAAKEKIGEYQPQAGQFLAWEELADATEDERERKGYPEDEPLLRTGDLLRSIEHKVVGTVAVVGSDSDIAVYQELGTPTIPARSFLGGAAFEKTSEIVDLFGKTVYLNLVSEKLPKGVLPI